MGNVLKIMAVMILMLIVVSFQYVFSSAQNNHSTLETSGRDAIQHAVNLGGVRVNEEVSINPEIAKEAFIRQFAEVSNFDDGTRVLNIVGLNANPAMMAVESYQILEDYPISSFIGQKKEARVRDVDTIIYESKNTEDKRGGNVK